MTSKSLPTINELAKAKIREFMKMLPRCFSGDPSNIFLAKEELYFCTMSLFRTGKYVGRLYTI